MTNLETFIASLPSRNTSDLITLISRDSGFNNPLYALTSDGSGDMRAMSKAVIAIRAEIDLRLPPRQAPSS